MALFVGEVEGGLGPRGILDWTGGEIIRWGARALGLD